MRAISRRASAVRGLLCIAMLLWGMGNAPVVAQAPTRIVAQYGGASYAIAAGQTLICAGVGTNLMLFPAAQPTLTPLADLALPDVVRGLAIDGDLAYVALGATGLRIVSIAAATTPVVIGAANSTGLATAIALAGGYAYVADDKGGVAAFDVRDPGAPRLTAIVPTRDAAIGIAISGGYAYVADRNGGLAVLSLADPAHPVSLPPYEGVYEVLGVTVAGGYACLAASDEGLQVLSLADPAHPARVAVLSMEGTATSVTSMPQGSLDGGLNVCIGTQEGTFYVISLQNPAAPLQVSQQHTGGSESALAALGNYLLVADGPGGLGAYDLAAPDQPGLVGTYRVLPDVWEVVLTQQQYALVACGMRGLQSFETSALLSPGQSNALPVALDQFDTPGTTVDIALSGNYAYVADREGGLRIISVADPAHLIETHWIHGPAAANAVAVRGDYAYVACGDTGLWIVSVQDPAAPYAVNTVDTAGGATHVTLSGDYAYIADGDQGVCIVSIADTASAHVVATFPIMGYASHIVIVGNAAYVAGDAGLAILDVSDPTQPNVVGALPLGGTALANAVQGEDVYIAAPGSGLHHVRVTHPDTPQWQSLLAIPGAATNLTLDASGQSLLVSARDGGLAVVSRQTTYYSVWLPIMHK